MKNKTNKEIFIIRFMGVDIIARIDDDDPLLKMKGYSKKKLKAVKEEINKIFNMLY